MNNELLTLSDLLKQTKEDKSLLEEKVKSVNAEIENLQQEMIKIMVDEELSSFNRNGVTFSLVISEYPSPISEEKDSLWTAMKENGFEHLFTINSKTLQGTLKEIISENDDTLPDWLQGLVKTAEKSSIKVTKSKK